MVVSFPSWSIHTPPSSPQKCHDGWMDEARVKFRQGRKVVDQLDCVVSVAMVELKEGMYISLDVDAAIYSTPVDHGNGNEGWGMGCGCLGGTG